MCMLQSEILEVEYLSVFDARDYSRPGQDERGFCPCALIGKGGEVVSVL